MTVTELYDQLTDEELKDILTDLLNDNIRIGISRLRIIASKYDIFIIDNPQYYIYKQAATRWLKNQSK